MLGEGQTEQGFHGDLRDVLSRLLSQPVKAAPISLLVGPLPVNSEVPVTWSLSLASDSWVYQRVSMSSVAYATL